MTLDRRQAELKALLLRGLLFSLAILLALALTN